MLLREYAITPDVFDVALHSSEEVCGLHLDRIREVMLTEGLVRDLRDGEWGQLFRVDSRSWHRRAKELAKKLATQGRLIAFPALSLSPPADDVAWCAEALATHGERELTGGVLVTESVKAAYPDQAIVASIASLPSTPWWIGRSPSARLLRTLDGYRDHLRPVLHRANSILFVDPYLDPRRGGYREFSRLLEIVGRRDPAPRIEVHRVCWEDARDKRFLPEFGERIERSFRDALGLLTRDLGLSVEVYLWDDFHDRYVISNLIGISVASGFDITTNPNAWTTWTRLGRDDRDDVQREFDPASGKHELRHRFDVR